MQLVVGTSQQTWATNPRDGFRGWFPAGTCHAVPYGQAVALCGEAPSYVWAGDFDPGSRVLEVCGTCASLAR